MLNDWGYFAPYSYSSTGSQTIKEGSLQYLRYIFSFKANDNQRYIVWIDYFGENLYGVKFYQKNHELSDDKFKMLTQSGSPGRKIGTCLKIMVEEIVKKANSSASFIFIGSPLVDEPPEIQTKRFRLYQKINRRFFNPSNFYHYHNESKSILMISNKKDKNNKALNRAKEIYLDFTGIWKEEEE